MSTSAPDRPLILLSNDDGYFAEGLRTLAERLRRQADVVVCAPETEQSTTSHSLTLTRPLRLRRVEEGVFAVDGTPADCVYVALNAGTRVLHRRPDVVVSGMNHGLNLGSDIFYSGTVAAAREGVIRGVPAVATSADPGADRERAADMCAAIAVAFAEIQMRSAAAAQTTTTFVPDGDAVAARVHALQTGLAPLLNVNVPPGRDWPVLATRLGLRVYDDIIEFRRDPRGREYLWLGGGGVRHGDVPNSDTDAYDRGAVSITPLLLDLTAAGRAGLAEAVARGCRPVHAP